MSDPAPLVRAATGSSGQPLPAGVRGEMEAAFGHDFSQVRVHADARASASADLLDAPAYASGFDLVFGAGRFAPETDDGRSLLAHELAHVVQADQGGAPSSPGVDAGPHDVHEQDASAAAREALEHHESQECSGGDDCHCAKCSAKRSSRHQHKDGGGCRCAKCRAKAAHDGAAAAEDAGGGEQSCGCKAGRDAGSSQPSVTAGVVQRAPWEERREPGQVAGHTGGSDYQGPSGPVTRADQPASIGGSTALGGTVSYGCYCGPGGDPTTGSRCGAGAPAVDEIDEQCRQHDANYGMRHVDSGDRPGTSNMWSLEGWLASADADEQLRSSVERAMDADPGGFSPSARLYGQGIKGIFGTRARTAEAYQWGSAREGEAEAGINQAEGAASDSLSSRFDQGSSLLDSELGGASSFLSTSYDRAAAGINDFVGEASSWSSIGDVASGVAGGLWDAANFGIDTELGALGGVLGAAGDTSAFFADTALSGGAGALGYLGRGASFAANTGLEALGGAGGALLDAAEWGTETTGAIADVGLDLAGQGASWLVDQVSSLDPSSIAGPLVAPSLPSIDLPSLGDVTEAASGVGDRLLDLFSF